MELIFVSDFCNIPLAGLCRSNNKLCRFVTDPDNMYGFSIYPLSTLEKVHWLSRKWLFEICVGTQYSYKNNKPIGVFHWRHPIWLHKKLFNLYYHL